MKIFTLCLNIFTFFILTWKIHCFYNYDSSRSLINKDTMQMKNKLKHERLLAEVGVLEEKQTAELEMVPFYKETNEISNKSKDKILNDYWNNNSHVDELQQV
ncbi:fam-g protein [Plasmodium gallinaceum]|uniref:Fam-g protein n=1 Tax=Plasmodium gallinaceum TaxID=5849 RepID=A0A1J1GZ98_PLAGA|nr:fam-g protein [Plasmodium gallinaceum]CRG97789.1 fam-g protein [Plasmodium gallinaceum]